MTWWQSTVDLSRRFAKSELLHSSISLSQHLPQVLVTNSREKVTQVHYSGARICGFASTILVLSLQLQNLPKGVLLVIIKKSHNTNSNSIPTIKQHQQALATTTYFHFLHPYFHLIIVTSPLPSLYLL